ncbi:MAG: NUDIX hydrolase [Alphaproteobacteria bacterium]
MTDPLSPHAAAVAAETQTDVRTYPARPIVGVGAVVWRDDRVLLIQRGKPPRLGEWSIPGGAQEVGETVEAAARREVREETGVEIEITGFLAVVDAIRPDGEGRIRSHYTLLDFSAEWISGEARPGDDAADCRWVHPARLVDYGLWDETLRIIRLSADRRTPRAAARR